ncbi:MAG: hypothetical protein WBA57_06855 [Elainellaceae cyanobacterium]
MIDPEESNFSKFITYCRTAQPHPVNAIERFFEGVVGFPYDNELLLQAYLFLKIHDIFPDCRDLLLFEKPPYGDFTNVGKCDFVYLTKHQRVVLIETKYIDTRATGDTERKRRNKHRNKVIDQVSRLKETFCDYWKFDPSHIECAVFTTDPSIAQRGVVAQIQSDFIAIEELLAWQSAKFREAECQTQRE